MKRPTIRLLFFPKALLQKSLPNTLLIYFTAAYSHSTAAYSHNSFFSKHSNTKPARRAPAEALVRHDHHSGIQHHPLMEISESPGHLLLLKLWRREEDIFARRIARKKSRMDSIRRELFQLCCFLLIFHGFFTTILFTSSFYKSEDHQACKKWWIPSVLSLLTSFVFVFLVQVNRWRYWKVWNQLQRDKSVNRALTRCIQELRMKGASFDLSKEPQSGKRMKSSSVENKWKPLTRCSQYLIIICLVCFAGLVFPVSKLMLCGL